MGWRYCPKLTSETEEAHIEYINRHMYRHYNLPNKDDDPELHDVVNFYQNILIPKLVENTRTSNVDLTLANSSQIEQLIIIIAEPLPGDLADEL